MKFEILFPSTITVGDLNNFDNVNVYLGGMLYFFRDLDKKFNHIKINIKHKGVYNIDNGKILNILPIEINKLSYNLPEPDRDRLKRFIIVKNYNLKGSPARNFTNKGVIEIGENFFKLPFPVRLYVLLHEVAHFFYESEINCDLWAAKKFIEMGYNNSTAFYALSKVLNCQSKSNEERIAILFNHLNK